MLARVDDDGEDSLLGVWDARLGLFRIDREALGAELGRRRWSMSELARRAGIHPNTVHAVLRGNRDPKHPFCGVQASTLWKIEEALGFRRSDQG
jgi:hypothetical protein